MKFKTFLIAALGLGLIKICSADHSDSNPYRHTQVLDTQGKYVLDWLADIEESRIYFNVTVKTKGYVGFGLSKKGLMLGADIVIGGVHPNGSHYFADRHGVADHKTMVDAKQDWKLLAAWESKTHTFLSFSTPFETCDTPQDLGITNDLTTLIWAYGERDNENEYHYENRGTHNAYLLDPDLTPTVIRQQYYKNVTQPQPISKLGDWKVWSIPVDHRLSSQDTSYICTFHKAPTKTKNHIVGFRPVLGEYEKRFVHHFFFHICYAPKGVSPDVLFGRYLGHPGEQCYELYSPQNRIPTQYCQEIRFTWAVGAEATFFPDHVGMALSETHDEYYMLQVHYDNPQELSGVRLRYDFETYYTSKLRKHDVGLLYTGVATPGAPSIVVPPSDPRHVIYGHCATGCINKMIPKTGVHAFAGVLHTHLTGTGVRQLHIQNLQEHALLADDNYNFYYQPTRILRDERTILPGDMMVTRCIYDTTNRNRSTVGGFSTRNEMCNVLFWYYPYIKSDTYALCAGELRSDAYRNDLQIFQHSWSDERRAEIVTSPPSNAGLTIEEATTRIKWDINKRTQLQTHQRFLPQVSKCPSVGPEAVTHELLGLAGYAASSPLTRYVEHEVKKDLGKFTNMHKEIESPGNEFVSLWPKDLSFYSPPTICPK